MHTCVERYVALSIQRGADVQLGRAGPRPKNTEHRVPTISNDVWYTELYLEVFVERSVASAELDFLLSPVISFYLIVNVKWTLATDQKQKNA